ncbi:transcriptional activator RfaH [Yoonia sp.]|uniref:transcription termination/antitermination protein NusG n=1 Tax=Yoonia sp. TaxID=2212373 RepID=UPI002E05B1E9|nr:transcriptional activator RfaH [Yoonia sp.]
MLSMPKNEEELQSEHQSNWYLVQMKPNCLKIAERNLARQGFGVFCPRYETNRRYRNVFRKAVLPLFTGYLFCQIGDDPLAFRAVNSTYGVSKLVRFGASYPRPVPAKFIAGLRDRCDADGFLKKIEEMKAGDQIRIVNGPFADYITRVEQIQDDSRVLILLDLLGQAVKTYVGKDDVEVIS